MTWMTSSPKTSMHPVKVMTEHSRLLFPLDEALRDWLDFMRSLNAEEKKALEWAVQGCVPEGQRMLDFPDFEWLRDTLLEFIDAEKWPKSGRKAR